MHSFAGDAIQDDDDDDDDDDDADDAGDGGQLGKNVLMLRNLRQSATYTCVASSDLGNIAYDVDVIVKGVVTLSPATEYCCTSGFFTSLVLLRCGHSIIAHSFIRSVRLCQYSSKSLESVQCALSVIRLST